MGRSWIGASSVDVNRYVVGTGAQPTNHKKLVSMHAKIDWFDPETLAKMKRIRKIVIRKFNGRWRRHKHDLYVEYYLDKHNL